MIYPDKTIELKYTLLGVGSMVLSELDSPQTTSSLWESVKTNEEIGTFEKFVLTLDFLYLLGLIRINEGLIERLKT